jgi:hypothetical protein
VNKLYGEMRFHDEPHRLSSNIGTFKEDLAPAPTHSRLINYNSRRLIHVLKLLHGGLGLPRERPRDHSVDLQNAQNWLIEPKPDAQTFSGTCKAGRTTQFYRTIFTPSCGRSTLGSMKPIHETRLFAFCKPRHPLRRSARS